MFGEGYAARSDRPAATASFSPVQPAFGAAPALDVAEYWRLAVKYRLLILGIFLAAIVLGVAATLLITPIYSATTTLQIDREAARVLDAGDVAPRESMVQGEEFFQTQYGLLRSRSLSEKVADSLGLATSDAFLNQMGSAPPRRGERSAAAQNTQRREAVIRVLQDNLSVSPVRGSRLVSVSFESPDAVLSARIANAFAENFIRSNQERKYESSSYAREFLEGRIAQTKARLGDAERQLVAYAENQQIINIREAGEDTGESQSLVSSNLSALNAALAEARADRIAREEKWRQASGAALFSLPEVLNNPALQRLSEERIKVNAEYEQKSRVFQPDYPEMVQLRAQADELTREINSFASSVRSSIRGDFDVAANRERSLARQVDGLKEDVLDLRARSVQYGILQREVDTSRTLYDALLQRYAEVGVTGGVTTNNISIVDSAKAPNRPSKPRLLVNIALAALFGLGLGVALAFLLEALDETLASPDDVESKLGLPVLGVIPLLDKGVMPKQALADLRSNFAEAYYSLRTALQFSTPEGAPHTLLVTSSRPAEGKSTTAYATALNLARLGRRVLLADGDLRNPSMHRVVGVENNAGMSNLLSGDSDLATLARPTDQPGLDFIPCGPTPPNPAELWGGDRVKRMLEEAMRTYDHIVIDGPPVLGFADSPLLASAVQGTVFVLESKGTRRAQARGALRRLALGQGHILGVVLTKFNTKTVQYGSYDYSYDYNYGAAGSADTKPSRKKRW
jgi:succinoglycan biosynthesis transport protein ExoP